MNELQLSHVTEWFPFAKLLMSVLKEDVPKWNVWGVTLWRCRRRTVWEWIV